MNDTTAAIAKGIQNGERHALAKAITLIESSRFDHREQADLLMEQLASKEEGRKNTLRLGIAGPPGAGKSTFIEALGMRYVNNGNKVAVIPVDPSSHINGGSILGDKTRMEQLSRSDKAYVRASPTRGVLGGIAEHTSDVISLCESAGYNVVIVESVGLGQSEVDIDSAVDMLILLVPPGGGDSLQASKKGIMEAADLVIVNKADGSLLDSAKHTKADYSGTMQFIRQKNNDWRSKVLMISAATGFNMELVEQEIANFQNIMIKNQCLWTKRTTQAKHWMRDHFRRLVLAEAERNPRYPTLFAQTNKDLEQRAIPPRVAAKTLFENLSQ